MSISMNFTAFSNSIYENSKFIFPMVVDTAIKFGLQDQRIGRIVGGISLVACGLQLFRASGVKTDTLQSWLGTNENQDSKVNDSKKALKQLGIAAVGLSTTCFGIYNVAMGVAELITPASFYLVCHDNKPKNDIKTGHPLPRLGVVNADSGEYIEVKIDENNPLRHSKDLESLVSQGGNKFITCESKGRCFNFELKQDKAGLEAVYKSQFSLPVPSDRFYNIEGIALKNEDSKICWSHRGGIKEGEEPWTRCASIDMKTGDVGLFVEQQMEDPFAIKNRLNRAIADHAVGSKTGADYFIGTIDTEGSEGIEAVDEEPYSILYTNYQCLKRFLGEKMEALYINPEETQAVIATDNEEAGSKICKYGLESGEFSCKDVRKGEEYAIGGIAPIKIGFKFLGYKFFKGLFS